MKPALDATITVEKKSLFSVLNEEAETNEDDDELSVIEPTQPSSSGFPAFEPTLDRSAAMEAVGTVESNKSDT